MAINKTETRDRIFSETLAAHGVKAEELFDGGKPQYLVEARRSIATQLYAAGFSVSAIARALKVDRSCIYLYLGPQHGFAKPVRRLIAKNQLPQQTSDMIRAMAQAEGISPTSLLMRWIQERAEFEASRRKVAA